MAETTRPAALVPSPDRGPASTGASRRAGRAGRAALLASALAVGIPPDASAQSMPAAGSTDDLRWPEGLRSRLKAAGFDYTLQDTNDLLGNPTGGRAQGATVEGQVALTVDVDLAEALGLEGTTAKASGYGVYGRGLSARNIDNINLVSSIEALRSIWLYELWVQKATPDGALDLRLGQLGADTEFLVTENGGWFVNTAFGWPSLPSVDLPAGGPAYPLATPGLRLRWKPTGTLTMLAALFNGDPAGPGLDNPQRRDPDGTSFRVGDGVFAIAEVRYDAGGGPAPTTVKAGAWYHSKASPNRFYANDGLTSVSAAGSGIARQDGSLYGVVDAPLLPGPGGKGGLATFARVSFAPPGISKVTAELAGGLVYDDPFGRDGDKAGLAVTSIRVGQALGGGAAASRYAFHGYETAIEASYRVQATKTVQIQPDAQYIAHPGGGIPDPGRPGREVGSAAVFGVRVVATF